MSYGMPDTLNTYGDGGTEANDNSLYDIDHGATDQAIAAGMDTGPSAYDMQNSIDAAQGVNSRNRNNPGDISAQTGVSPVNPAEAAPDDYTMQNMIASANAVNQSAGQPYPGDIRTAAGLPGGAPSGPPADLVTSTTPGISSTTSGLPGGGGAGAHQLSEAEWDKDFKDHFGYFDPQYDSRDAFLLEEQRGDRNIRGVGGGGDQVAYMAGLDSDAARNLAAIRANGEDNFYNSQMATDEARAHNQSLTDQANALGGGGTQAAGGGQTNGRLGAAVTNAVTSGNRAQLDWLKSQVVDVPANPMKNSEAFSLQTQMAKDLVALGVDPATLRTNGTDLYFTPPSGGLAVIYGDQPGKYISLADWVDRAAQLHASAQAKVAADNAKAQSGVGGGGGGYPRSTRSYGGYGGGGGAGAGTTYPAGNEMIDQSAAGGGMVLPGNNTKPGYYPGIQSLGEPAGYAGYRNNTMPAPADMGNNNRFVNPSGATVYYTPEGQPYGYYYGSKNAVAGIEGERRGLPY